MIKNKQILPKLLFPGGSHGNFLSRSLSVASGIQQDFDFYADRIGAHNLHNFTRVVDHGHHFDEKDIFCNITIDVDDLYIFKWHTVYAGADLGLDFLKINSYHKLWQFKEKIPKFKTSQVNRILGQVRSFEDDGISGLREFFKRMHNDNVGFIQSYEEELKEKNISNHFKFEWFYNKDLYIENVKILLEKLGLQYKVDISKHVDVFLNRKQEILQSKQLVEYALRCYIKSIPVNISNFCLYQQGYFDHLIEQHLGYEIENWQHYPTNIADYKPTQAYEGKKYDI